MSIWGHAFIGVRFVKYRFGNRGMVWGPKPATLNMDLDLILPDRTSVTSVVIWPANHI